MKKLAYFVILITYFGCSTKIDENNIKNLNGYWEISEVTFADGETKAFNVNPTIDYIEVKDAHGFRKKVYPKFDGTFETTDDADYFSINKTNDKFEMCYKPNMTSDTRMCSRNETLVQLSKNSFSVVNKDTITYTYLRFQLINARE